MVRWDVTVRLKPDTTYDDGDTAAPGEAHRWCAPLDPAYVLITT
jgi:hypothetical protein